MRTAGVGLVVVLALLNGGCLHGAEGNDDLPDWRILFVSDRGGEFALWSIRPDGSGLVRVRATNPVPDAEPPSVAPDGSKLLLPRFEELVVFDADGPRRIASAGFATKGSWSPDGDRIAFNGLSPGLSVIDADGKNGRRLTSDDRDDMPVWAPSGDRIAFRRSDVGVCVVQADGSDERVLWRGYPEALSWSEDGRTLSFLRSRESGADADLVTIDATTGRIVETVRGIVGSYASLARSPDGRRIAFQKWAGRRQERLEIVVANTDGTDQRLLSAPRERASTPIWAPDGRSILYLRYGGVGGAQLWTVRVDGSGRRQVTRGLPDGGNVISAVWARVPFKHEPSPFRERVSRTETGAELELPFPVGALGAAGSRVALAPLVRVYSPTWILTPPLFVWAADTGGVSRVSMRNCDVPGSIVLTGRQIAFDCRSIPHAVEQYGVSVLVSTNARRGAVALNSGYVGPGPESGNTPGRLPGRMAGARGAIVFAVDAFDGRGDYVSSTLWRVRGRRSKRIAVDVGDPVAVDAGRVVTEHPQGRVALLDLDGRVLRVFTPGGSGETPRVDGDRRPPTAGLSGRDLVVLRNGRLSWYDATSGRLRRALRVDERAVLAGVAGGLVAYVVRRDIHVVRLQGGGEAVFRARGRGVKAQLTSAGLFYTAHPRAVTHHSILEHERNPARITFIRRTALVARLA